MIQFPEHACKKISGTFEQKPMSQAFVKESDGEWLHDVLPALTALIQYLTRENNGIRVYEKSRIYSEKHGREIHLMSNGLGYAKDDTGKWYIAE